ncbi:phosphatidylinositol N-acetylglucosaminyltransferase subunit Q, putative [Babesia caballi]|uniref:Phosphatidylinositol N-acetylglucosaminyltransferase subunit Q, putative n=1 Tax=Babesia caballi TaxID=5871 RepID=A0AAV4LN05_BABCB|nr:phosphatidylinositol N-acetylglucosaminyltransferase subunit Q, putative [Babesia caballi]
MERQPVTVYLPAADHRRLCSGDVDRLLVGWDSPSLEAIVAVASFPSWQKPALVAALHDLERMPELRHVFCRHGSLALLDNFPPEGGPSGLRLQGSSGCLPHTRVIKYAVDDFNVVTFAELLALGTNCQQQCASSGCASSSHTSLSSYLIVGRALAGRLNDLLRAKSTDSPLADSSAPLSLLQASRRRCRAFIEAAATTLRLWMIRIVVCASLTAQRLLSVAALFRSPLLQKWMQQTTFISVLSNRLSQAALWQERYAQLQLQTGEPLPCVPQLSRRRRLPRRQAQHPAEHLVLRR